LINSRNHWIHDRLLVTVGCLARILVAEHSRSETNHWTIGVKRCPLVCDVEAQTNRFDHVTSIAHGCLITGRQLGKVPQPSPTRYPPGPMRPQVRRGKHGQSRKPQRGPPHSSYRYLFQGVVKRSPVHPWSLNPDSGILIIRKSGFRKSAATFGYQRSAGSMRQLSTV
jgi:hypothetical protein